MAVSAPAGRPPSSLSRWPAWSSGWPRCSLSCRRGTPPRGTVFVGALAAYTVCRQVLFPYRAEPRKSSLGRGASMIAAGLVLIADIIVAIVA